MKSFWYRGKNASIPLIQVSLHMLNNRPLVSLICLAALFSSAYNTPSGRSSRDRSLDEISSELIDLKQKAHSYQIENEILEEKLNKQEDEINALRAQLKELTSHKFSAIERKIDKLEKANENLIADLRQFKIQANDTANALGSLKNQLHDYERNVDSNLANIKKVMGSLLKLSEKEIYGNNPSVSTVSSSETYVVKSGDSLEKIARMHHSTVESLKKINNLTSDRIRIGQELKITSVDAP